MPFNFAPIPVDGVGNLFGRRVLEMHGLTGERTESCANEEEPGEQLRPGCRRADEAPGLFPEVEQDGAGIEHAGLGAARSLGVDDRGNLAVRIDGAEGGRVLFALAGVDGHDFVGQAKLFQQERDFRRIGRRVEIEADHGDSPGVRRIEVRFHGRAGRVIGQTVRNDAIAAQSICKGLCALAVERSTMIPPGAPLGPSRLSRSPGSSRLRALSPRARRASPWALIALAADRPLSIRPLSRGPHGRPRT